MLNKLKLASIMTLCAVLSACATAEAPKKAEIEKEAHYQPLHKISSSKTIASDTKNIKYDEKTTTTVAKVPVMPELKDETVEKAPVKEVVKVAEAKVEKPKVKKAIPIIRKPAAKKAPSINYQIANILFANGSSVVDASYNAEIKKIATLAKKHNATIRVLGYASSRTKDTDIVSHKLANFKVSLNRAESVAAALRKAGVKQENITIEALSDSHPLYSESMPEGERLNRRAEVYISY